MRTDKIMKYLLLVISLSVFLSQSGPLMAQYVQRDEYQTEEQRRQQYALDDWISYLSGKQIVSVDVGVDYIYFATLDGGILRYQIYQNFWDYPFTTSNGLPSNRILNVVYDNDNGYLWAITEHDTSIFLPAQQEWLRKSQATSWFYVYPGRKEPNPEGPLEKNVFYPRDYLDRLPTYFVNGPWTLIENWQIMDENFDTYPITGFLMDNWERIWFTIEDLGIGVGGTLIGRFDVVPFGLPHIVPKVLAFQYNDLWIGGAPGSGPERPGIATWQDRDGSWNYYQARWLPDLPSDNVRDIAVNGDSVWFATDYGLTLFDTHKNQWKNFDLAQGLWSRDILDLMIYNNILYISTDNGLNMLDLPTGIVKRDKAESILLSTFNQTVVEQDTLWAATQNGIFKRAVDDTSWITVYSKAAISEAPVIAVTTFNKEIWFTSNEGVFWFDTVKKTWTAFPQLGLEISPPFFDIKVNSKSVWVSTPEGLLKYNRQMNYWKIFTTEDGLLSNDCYRLLLDGDYIWVANREGITQFYWNSPARID
jgi:hypothetical protein